MILTMMNNLTDPFRSDKFIYRNKIFDRGNKSLIICLPLDENSNIIYLPLLSCVTKPIRKRFGMISLPHIKYLNKVE